MLASEFQEVKEIKEEFNRLASYVSLLKQRYLSIYEGSPNLLRTIDTNGIIINCNETYANSLGYSKKELIGTSIFDTVADESIDLMKESFESWKKFGSVRNREVLFKRKDGTVFPVLVNASNIYDENGRLVGSNTVIHDLSEIYSNKKRHEEFEKILQKNLHDIQTQRIEKEEFVKMITNELHFSAIHIKNNANALSVKNKDASELKLLEEIKLKSKSITKMMSDISDLQKIQHGELYLIKNNHNLSNVIKAVISMMQQDATFRRCTIIKDIQESVSCVCDKKRIEQVLFQIISNAIDFSPENFGEITVKLRNVVGKYAKIVVKDNGIGIKKENLEKIFTKFYQLNTSIIREHGGAGLGLSICKGIVERHSGKIWAHSKGTDAGAEIHILLPLEDPNYNKLRKIC